MKNLKPTLLCGMMLPAALSAQERPNILYIMTDQQTANAMSCAGNTDLRTPNMDKLAERGIRFTNAYCSMPLSGPSRGAMFTGYMPGEVGLLENGTPMPDSLHSTSLGVLMNKDNTVRQAGGFIIQLMPFCDEKVIEKLEQRLAEVNSVTAFLDEGLTPEQILEKLLGDMDLVINDTVPTQFYCNCSRERVSKALIAVGRKELNEMIQEAKPVELKCHFCNSAYEFSTEDLKELLRKSK